MQYDPSIDEANPKVRDAFIKVEYGNNLSIKKLNKLDDYLAIVADPPWSNLVEKLDNKPSEFIIPKNVDELYLRKLAKKSLKINNIVGIGGGLAIDVGKYISWKWDIPYMRIPSAISVDAFLTREIGIRIQDKVRYIGRSEPNNVVIDYDLIRSAPPILNYAGTCDVLSICTALGDWKIANELFGEKFDQSIFERAYKLADDMLKKASELKTMNDASIKYLVDCLIAECNICEDWGNARPEEGGEHHLAYCVEKISPKRYLHGSLVALNILVVLRLQGSKAVFDWKRIKSYFDSLGHEYKPKQIGIERQTYERALNYIQEYVKLEKLEKGIFYTDNPFSELSIKEILDWMFNL